MLRAPSADNPCGLPKAKGSAEVSEAENRPATVFAYVYASKQFEDPEYIEACRKCRCRGNVV